MESEQDQTYHVFKLRLELSPERAGCHRLPHNKYCDTHNSLAFGMAPSVFDIQVCFSKCQISGNKFFAVLFRSFVRGPSDTNTVGYLYLPKIDSAGHSILSCLAGALRRAREDTPDKNKSGKYLFIAAFVCGLAAMFTREIVVTLPVSIICYEVFFVS